jgi:hypothetical protein
MHNRGDVGYQDSGNGTGRSFMPGASPKGKLARWVSPGRIEGLPVFEGVDVLARVGELVGPFLGDARCPGTPGVVFFRRL